jgi:hypothetical protein
MGVTQNKEGSMRQFLTVAIAALILLAACVAPTATPTPATDDQSKCVSWTDASRYAGQTKCVCGPVVSANYATPSKGKPTFLNIGADYPSSSRFVVLIWQEHRDGFPEAPEGMYRGKSICVKGGIQKYQGIAQVEATTASQIQTQ